MYVFDDAVRRENTKKVFLAQLPELAATGRVHLFMPGEAIAHFLDAIARSQRGAASTSRSSDRPRTPSAILQARKQLTAPAPTIVVDLDALRRFFNYDLDLEKAFKAIQRKVQAGEPITEVHDAGFDAHISPRNHPEPRSPHGDRQAPEAARRAGPTPSWRGGGAGVPGEAAHSEHGRRPSRRQRRP